MKTIVTLSLLATFFSFSLQAETALYCFPSHKVDDGLYFHVTSKTGEKPLLNIFHQSISGDKKESSNSISWLAKHDYSSAEASDTLCSLSFHLSSDEPSVLKRISASLHENGFVGISIKHFTPGFTKCSYQSEMAGIPRNCPMGGSSELTLAFEEIYTTTPVFKENPEDVYTFRHEQISCGWNLKSEMIKHLFDCKKGHSEIINL